MAALQKRERPSDGGDSSPSLPSSTSALLVRGAPAEAPLLTEVCMRPMLTTCDNRPFVKLS
eukprot:CAMPEP_0119386722 /NCGR_PEP_ID=MMETSP1334-20130426/97325_1 /TAXON_ID=127549 /ORGANISM="Calcidiscus leptoporus, Strain RCC1130" /LENGTH=60 /DNA_ID=CAMNT_0007408277 /DNA_START=305 /DNA_END=486 /DNA_ORIENTATION=+